MFIRILRVITLILSFLMFCAGWFLLGRTYVDTWLPLASAFTAGLLFAWMFARTAPKLTGIQRKPFGAIILFVVFSITAFFTVLTANYTGADLKSAKTVDAELIEKHVRTEYGTRRVGRGRYVRDSSKKIYHYEYTLRLPDGHTIERKTNASDYITLRQGLHYPVELRQGALGWTVIR